MVTAARFKTLYFTIYGLSILYLYLTPSLALARVSQLALLVLSACTVTTFIVAMVQLYWFYRLEWLFYGGLFALASLLVIKITLLPVSGYWLIGLVSCYAALYVMRRTIYWRDIKQSGPNDQPAAAAQPAGASPAPGHADTNPEGTQLTYPARRAKVTFKDVVGMADVKARLRSAGDEILNAMHPPHGQEGQAEPRNGILLYGAPGNGKTFFAEAFAGEFQLPFLSVSFGDVASRWVNQTTEQVRQVFHEAALQAPCVLFIDEIDSLLVNRATVGWGDSETARTTNVILTEAANLRDRGIVLMAATNFIDRLDEAGIREGRFDYKIEITPPDFEARRHLLQIYLNGKIPGQALPEADIDRLAQHWDGFSVARIKGVATEALDLMAHHPDHFPKLDFSLMMTALRYVQGRSGWPLPENLPELSELVMPAELSRKIHGLANRMMAINEIEALGGKAPTGVLFYGPPGTGKTFTVESLAKTTGWAFIPTSGQDLVSNANRVDEILDEARNIRPAIVFIDEAEDILSDRQYSNYAIVTNKLLAAIDGSSGKIPDVVFIAATNHPEDLDSAAIRGGRFSEKIEFGLPGPEEVKSFVQKWLATSCHAKVAPDVTVDAVATLLQGLSQADIHEILTGAINAMIERAGLEGTVCLDDVRAAVHTVTTR